MAMAMMMIMLLEFGGFKGGGVIKEEREGRPNRSAVRRWCLLMGRSGKAKAEASCGAVAAEYGLRKGKGKGERARGRPGRTSVEFQIRREQI